jgi:hypothetical protein
MSNSVAIVTGASSGIEKATAIRLARDFGAIVLTARSGEKLGEVGQQVKAIGAEPLVLEIDLMAPTAAEVVVEKTLDRFWPHRRLGQRRWRRRRARRVPDDRRPVEYRHGAEISRRKSKLASKTQTCGETLRRGSPI